MNASRRIAMPGRRFALIVTLLATLLAACSGSTPAVPATATAPTSLAAATGTAAVTPAAGAAAAPSATAAAPAAAPFIHTACAAGVSLAGQTITFYNLTNNSAEIIEPTVLALQDAADYFNAHGGICGAQVVPDVPNPGQGYDVLREYHRVSTHTPKPALIGVYSSAD